MSRDVYKQFNDASETQGLFAAGVLTYQSNPKTSFDVGLRFGLTPASPRVGFSAGGDAGVRNLYKKHQ